MLGVFLGISQVALCQQMQMSFDVQAELSIEVLQDLDFGTVVTNSGTQKIPLGNAQMGIFKIRSLAAQNALLTLRQPDFLSSTGNETVEKIPIKIKAAYSDRPDTYNNVKHFISNSLNVTFDSNNQTSVSPNTWETGYVYIFGDLSVGDVSKGTYTGNLVLSVEYQ